MLTICVSRTVTVQDLCDAWGLSASMRRRMLARHQLTRDGRALAADDMVRVGECVNLAFVRTRVPGATSQTPAEVLWCDRLLLAANKPQDLLVHDDGTNADTLTARVQRSLVDISSARGWSRPPVAQALQRLDKDTSGVVLFSLTEEFQPTFDAMIAGHVTNKRYLAVVEGKMRARPLLIDQPIARNRHDARRMRVGPTGKPSRTLVMPLEHARGRTLVACELLSGRRHQIRVHLSHLGYPIVGDALYGHAGSSLMLHAIEESFVHPLFEERILLRTEWPVRFAKLFSARAIDWSILGDVSQTAGGKGRRRP